MLEVYRLSLRQLTGPLRLALILLLGALPVALAVVLVWASGHEGIERDGYVNLLLNALLVAGVLPVVTMTLATAAFGNEVEDGTLGNLALMPLARWRIVLAKLSAVFTLSGPVIIVSGVATYIVGFGLEVQAVLSLAAGLLLGVAAYSSVFTWTGLMTGRALAVSLLYVVLWEGIIGSLIAGVGYLSVRGYTLAVMHGLDSTAFGPLEGSVISLPAALAGALLVTIAFYGLGTRRLTTMDIP